MSRSILEDFLGAIIGAYSPSKLRNPDYLDAEGRPVQGQSPYRKAGFGTRLFHPEVAEYVGRANDEAAFRTAKAYDEGRAVIDKTRAITSPIARFFDSSLTPDELASIIINGGFDNVASEAVNSFALKNQDSKTLGEMAALKNKAAAEVAAKNAINDAETVDKKNAIKKDVLTTEGANAANDVRWLPTDLATANHNKINALQDAGVIKPLASEIAFQDLIDEFKNLGYKYDDKKAQDQYKREALEIEAAKQAEVKRKLPIVVNSVGRNIVEANRQAMHPSTDIHGMYIDRDGKVKTNPFYSNPANWGINDLLQSAAKTSTTGTQAPAAIRVAPNVNLRTRPAVKPNVSNVVTRPNAGVSLAPTTSSDELIKTNLTPEQRAIRKMKADQSDAAMIERARIAMHMFPELFNSLKRGYDDLEANTDYSTKDSGEKVLSKLLNIIGSPIPATIEAFNKDRWKESVQ